MGKCCTAVGTHTECGAGPKMSGARAPRRACVELRSLKALTSNKVQYCNLTSALKLNCGFTCSVEPLGMHGRYRMVTYSAHPNGATSFSALRTRRWSDSLWERKQERTTRGRGGPRKRTGSSAKRCHLFKRSSTLSRGKRGSLSHAFTSEPCRSALSQSLHCS